MLMAVVGIGESGTSESAQGQVGEGSGKGEAADEDGYVTGD